MPETLDLVSQAWLRRGMLQKVSLWGGGQGCKFSHLQPCPLLGLPEPTLCPAENQDVATLVAGSLPALGIFLVRLGSPERKANGAGHGLVVRQQWLD